jgi:hypothetical protein
MISSALNTSENEVNSNMRPLKVQGTPVAGRKYDDLGPGAETPARLKKGMR